MFHRAPRILAQLLLLAWAVGPGRSQDSEDKELELQSCIDGFVVHRDKIIRTQDSRDMGAQYLTEFDVESRLECMKLCCATKHCDVFIFEEKKPGSCYLFHCGPPQDFKCKFTNHANYSSAVLTNYNLQGPSLEEQIRRNQQEHELKSLRKLEPPSKEYSYFTNAPVLTSTTLAPAPSTTSTTSAPVKIPTCSRNQFECRSNDDCIAIYNVCDGIPQCADGSDEAAELGCPVERTTLPPPPPPPPPPVVTSPKPYIPMLPDVLRYQQMFQQSQQQQQQQQHAQYPILYPGGGHVPEGSKNWAMSNPNLHEIGSAQEVSYDGRGYGMQQQQLQLQQVPDESMSSGGSGAAGMGQQPLPLNYKPPGYQWSNYQAPIYEPNPNKINSNAALDVMHAQNALPPAYEQEQPPHIFKHKGPSMHLDDIEAANSGLYGQDPNRVYAPYYQSGVHRVESWQEGNPVQPMPIMTINTRAPPPENSHIESQKHLTTSTAAPPCDPSEKQEDNSNVQNGSVKKLENDEAQKRVHSTPKEVKNNANKTSDMEVKPLPEKIVQTENHRVHEAELRTIADTHHQEHKSMAITEHIARHSTKLEDLEMSRPKGAVISLALGLTVTAVMAVLIACRLRVVKRRGRGRGHEFAHDADYLVNGMYL